MGALSDLVDRVLNTTATTPRGEPSVRAMAVHASTPIVDLVVGSALFRDRFLTRSRHGHADLPRLRAGGARVVGLTIATRHPDLRGTLSNIHFRSRGIPPSRLVSNMAIADWLLARIHGWVDRSGGRLRLIRTLPDLRACIDADGPLGVLIGVQGGHVLDGDARNVHRLVEQGVRMFAPAHVMDNQLVGSGTGRQRGGLTGFGREVVAEVEAAGMLVDLAHMSLAGIRDALPLLRPPFVLSHTGLTETSDRVSRVRRYSPRTRNIPVALAQEVAAAGGVVGVVMSTWLLGGQSIERAADAIELAVDAAGAGSVALGSDLDGGLRTVIDATGYPLITDRLLARGLAPDVVRRVMGLNAIGVLSLRLGGR